MQKLEPPLQVLRCYQEIFFLILRCDGAKGFILESEICLALQYHCLLM
jgi:hypothetical protein